MESGRILRPAATEANEAVIIVSPLSLPRELISDNDPDDISILARVLIKSRGNIVVVMTSLYSIVVYKACFSSSVS